MKRDASLPSIKDMYNCTRENYDYNVIRKYEGKHKLFGINAKPTKKDHYLDQSIKLNCSPGPANLANSLCVWFKKSSFQCKRAPKETYLDIVQKRQKKLKFPAPNNYDICMQWPEKSDQPKVICEKTNFADTCQYDSDKIPGPGTYNIRTYLSATKDEKKWIPHSPIKPSEPINAENGNYTPCPLDYHTFIGYQLRKNLSQQGLTKKSPQKKQSSSKQNQIPGPGAYSTVSFWPGKSPPKKNEHNYFNITTKGPSPRVYH